MPFSFAAFKRQAVQIAFEVDVYGVTHLSSTLNVQHAGIALLNCGDLRLHIVIAYGLNQLHGLKALVLAQRNLRIQGQGEGKFYRPVICHIDITFPENYTENLAGKAVVFHVVCNEVSSPEYPELDDEFAQDVSEFDTMADYRADVRSNLQKRLDDSAEAAFRDAVIQKASEGMTVEIPDVMVEEKVDEFLRNYASQFGMYERDMTREQMLKLFGMNEETLNSSIRPAAEMQVKTELMLEAVAKAENLEPTEEELDAYAAKMAEGIGASADDVKKYFGAEYLKAETQREQAMELIVANAVAKDAAEMPAASGTAEGTAQDGAEAAEEKE